MFPYMARLHRTSCKAIAVRFRWQGAARWHPPSDESETCRPRQATIRRLDRNAAYRDAIQFRRLDRIRCKGPVEPTREQRSKRLDPEGKRCQPSRQLICLLQHLQRKIVPPAKRSDAALALKRPELKGLEWKFVYTPNKLALFIGADEIRLETKTVRPCCGLREQAELVWHGMLSILD